MDKITEHNDSLPFFQYVIISWVQCDLTTIIIIYFSEKVILTAHHVAR